MYEWKVPGLYGADADVVGRELERINAKYGAIDPATVVDESRDESAPMHGLFEWDDEIAAERYREQQARAITANIVVRGCAECDEPVRAFVHVQSAYQPISVVIESESMTEELLRQAMRELETFERKYRRIEQLRELFEAMDAARGKIKEER